MINRVFVDIMVVIVHHMNDYRVLDSCMPSSLRAHFKQPLIPKREPRIIFMVVVDRCYFDDCQILQSFVLRGKRGSIVLDSLSYLAKIQPRSKGSLKSMLLW